MIRKVFFTHFLRKMLGKYFFLIVLLCIWLINYWCTNRTRPMHQYVFSCERGMLAHFPFFYQKRNEYCFIGFLELVSTSYTLVIIYNKSILFFRIDCNVILINCIRNRCSFSDDEQYLFQWLIIYKFPGVPVF